MKHFLVFLLISFVGKSQIVILDNSTHKPISNAEVFNNNGILINTTDENGHIEVIKADDYPITISHFLYHNLECKSFSNVLELIPKAIILNDVIVKAKANKYIILEGYYRGFQTKNDTLDIFTDAKIRWILSAKKYESVGYEILSSRFFISKKYKYYKRGKVLIGIKINTLPHLQTEFMNFSKNLNLNPIVSFDYKDNKGAEAEMKFLGNSSKIVLNQDEFFSISEQYPFENLKFFNHKHKLFFTPRKSLITDKYEAIDEFTPSQIYFSNKLPENTQKRIILSEKSNFNTNFWEEFEKSKSFKKLSSVIINSVENSMELVK